ncbi:MAG TPA: hypothetical protein PKA63_01350 [Oligoflexia bacterium]|nr:hypothetical protein [Oligoflexia bacterium]HMP47295.1 hypothetical protein [Oligoflexia bacterium]
MQINNNSACGQTLLGMLGALLIASITMGSMAIIGKNAMERRVINKTAKLIASSIVNAHEKSLYLGIAISGFVEISGLVFQLSHKSGIISRVLAPEKYISKLSIRSGTSSEEMGPVIRLLPNGYATPARIEIAGYNYLCDVRISLRGRVTESCRSI